MQAVPQQSSSLASTFNSTPSSTQLAPVPAFHGNIFASDEVEVEDASGSDLVDLSLTATTAVLEVATSDYASILDQVQTAVNEQSSILLLQRPGFGKTRLALELLATEKLLIFLMPTTALRDQVFHILCCLLLADFFSRCCMTSSTKGSQASVASKPLAMTQKASSHLFMQLFASSVRMFEE